MRKPGHVRIEDVVTGADTVVGVLEVDPTGHRLQYVRYLRDAAGPAGCVLLVPPELLATEEYATHLADTGDAVLPVDGSAGRARALAEGVDRALARGVTRIVIPDADLYLLPLLRLLVRRPRLALTFRLVLMRTVTMGGAEPFTGAMVVKPAAVALLRLFPQVRLYFLTDALGVVRGRRGFPGVAAVRDPVVLPSADATGPPPWWPAARAGGAVVGLFGVISPRKNLPVLVRAALTEVRANVVVAGTVWPEVAAWLDSDPDAALLRDQGRLVVVDRMLGAAEFGAALCAADVVAVLHDNDAPSGILAEACVRGTPALVPRGAWLEHVVASTGIGRATDLTAPGVADALGALLDDRAAHREAVGAARARIGTADFTSTLLAEA